MHFLRFLAVVCCCAGLVPVAATAQLTAVADTIVVGINDTVELAVTANDTSAVGEITFVSLDTGLTSGTATTNDSLGTITYVAPQDVEGDDMIGYEITDDSGATSAATVLIRLLPGFSVDHHTIALYKNEDDSTSSFRDVSNNRLHGTAFGTTLEAGPLGAMRCFDGLDDWARMNAVKDAVSGLSSLSIEFVAKAGPDGGYPGLVNHSRSGGWVLIPAKFSTVFSMKLTSTGNTWLGGSWQSAAHEEAADSVWHYVAMTWGNDDALRVYQNGVEIGVRSGGGAVSPQDNSNANLALEEPSSTYLSGCADEIRFSGTRFSAEDIALSWSRIRESLGQPSLVATAHLTDVDRDPEFSLYPNPFREQLTIRGNETSGVHRDARLLVSMFDITGRRVLRVATNSAASEVELPVSTLNRGTYFVQIRAEGDVLPLYRGVVVRQ